MTVTCLLDRSTVVRDEVVRPAMCGHNSLFVGQIGDWTWDAVSALCGTDVLHARDRRGAPTYLSFYYYRIRGDRQFHLRTAGFGDRLRVTTRLFDFGSESVLALHRIARTPAGSSISPAPAEADPIDPHRFYAAEPGVLQVETFNRWITRGDPRSNQDLVRCSPPGFRHEHLPTLPTQFSPRLACQLARGRLSFVAESDRYVDAGPRRRVDYTVDPSRDLNGVGLLYFASYFSIVDSALLHLWRDLGRSDASFLRRVVADQQLCYLGNADAGCVIESHMRHRRADSGREIVDVVLRDRGRGRTLAVCTLQLLPEAQS